MLRFALLGAVLAAMLSVLGGCEGAAENEAAGERASAPSAPSASSEPRVSSALSEASAPTGELPQPRTGAPAGDWLEGDVEAAFAAARATGRPVLLYWGADWCPYCAQLEAHVFSRRDFREKLELFVPVYLDGDQPGAQKWAEAFGIAGYPTVLALAPDRSELARIAGGMDLSVYPEVLDLVLGDVRPLDDVLDSVADAAATLTDDDCRRLAYNGWGLADTGADAAATLGRTLATAAARCASTPTEQARLTIFAAYYSALARTAAGDAAGPVPAPLAALVRDVRAIVADTGLASSIVDALHYLDGDFFTVAKRAAPNAAGGFLADWTAAMDAAFADSRYGLGVRLDAIRSKVEAAKGLSPTGEAPSGAAHEARRLVDAALAEIGDSPARPGIVNAAINLLVAVGEPQRAYEIVERELGRARTPYYYMADLAWLDETMGRHEAATEWLERAYEASAGPATRFQWGTSYVRGLIRMAPDDADAIEAAAIEVLGELEGPDRIYRRTRGRLETLEASLREWNASGEHGATLAALRRRMDEICAGIPDGEAEALASCTAFLAEARPADL